MPPTPKPKSQLKHPEVDYKKVYQKYHASAAAKRDRASRNAARAKVKRLVGAKRIQGKDIDHKDQNPRNNCASNLRVMSVKENRGRKSKTKAKNASKKGKV